MRSNIDFNSIPSDLRLLPQWVLWKSVERDGKKTKVPVQVDGELAQVNNRSTWATFATVAKYFLEGEFDGIGFVFSRQDKFIGIDIDDCVTYETSDSERVNPIISEFAKGIIDDLDSYTEISVSGTGIHIIVSGVFPQSVLGSGKKNSARGIEIYSHSRFFTMSSDRENSNEVFERTDEVADLLDKHFHDSEAKTLVDLEDYTNDEIKMSNDELWERMFRSKNGDKIRALYDGKLIDDDWSGSDQSLCNTLAFWTGKSYTRMDSMMRETGLMRDKWDVVHHSSGETYGERTINKSITDTDTTILDNQEDFSIVFHTDDVDDAKVTDQKFMLTEMGNAERVVSEYGHVFKHVDGIGWYVWDGKRWKDDRSRKIERLTSKTLRRLFKSADETDLKWAKQCEKRAIRMNSIKDMIPLVPATREEFDTHPFLLNVNNGIINLKNGELSLHDRKLMMTNIANVEYAEGAECPEWKKFLESIFLNGKGETDYELIRFIQKMIGYALTGDISEQVMFFLVGGGRNGKSTFINIIKNLLGDYGKQTNSDTFIQKRNESGINNDVARLAGSRFVSAVESEQNQKLAESTVKQITGGEPIMARFLRQEFFEFLPEFKVFFTTNHKPIIQGVDEGIWRRIRMIPFDVTIAKEDIDRKLPEKLSLEMSGILNWAIEGCLLWQKEGLEEPESIKLANKKYKEEMDILEPFIVDVCFLNPLAKIEAKDLYNSYTSWCASVGESGIGNRTFYRVMETKGIKRERGTGNKFFLHGIGLQKDAEQYIENDVASVTESNSKNPSVTFFKGV